MLLSLVTAAAVVMSNFPSVPVERTIDGDTLVVNLGDDLPEVFRLMSIRVKNIDSPEMRAKRICEKKDAKAAKSELSAIVDGSFVDLTFCEPDKYMRLACFVMADDGTDISEHMVLTQNANPYGASLTKIKWKCK